MPKEIEVVYEEGDLRRRVCIRKADTRSGIRILFQYWDNARCRDPWVPSALRVLPYEVAIKVGEALIEMAQEHLPNEKGRR